METTSIKHVMLVFLSDLKAFALNKPKHYTILGETIDCRQTNESAVLYMQGFLKQNGDSLDRIFMISSDMVCQPIQNEQGEILAPSSQEIFEQAVITRYPELAGRFQAVPYTEGPVRECMLQVASMAETIKDYCRLLDENTVCLHADMTGGFRHATMMMMGIMQLLTYSERGLSPRGNTTITIGKVLYSLLQQDPVTKQYTAGRIEDATDIHRMYNLISGVDEFAQYGSVDAIQRYFSTMGMDTISPVLRQLLDALQRFSDAIRLCRSDMIREVLHNLQKKIQAFRDAPGEDVSEQLFARIIVRVEEDYREVASDGADELDVMEWCLRTGFLQQALTFCTDHLPIYLVEQEICAPTDRKKVNEMGDVSHPHWQQGFIIKDEIAKDVTPKSKRRACQNLYKIFQDMLAEEPNDIQLDLEQLGINPAGFSSLLEDIGQADQLLHIMRQEMQGSGMGYPMAFLRQHAPFSRLLRFLYYAKADDGQSYAKFISKSLSRERILHILMAESREEDCVFNDKVYVLFKSLARVMQKKKQLSSGPKPEKSKQEKWLNRAAYWQQAFHDGRVYTIYPKQLDAVMDILRQYNDIRNVRNLINHASTQAGTVEDQLQSSNISAEHVEAMLRRCLQAIRCLERNDVSEVSTMKRIFINHTNHQTASWDAAQLAAAKQYGAITEIAFPAIDASWNEAEVYQLAAKYAEQIVAMQPAAVLCQGEFTYTNAMVQLLKHHDITVLAACSQRVVNERVDVEGHTIKESCFAFVRFREY